MFLAHKTVTEENNKGHENHSDKRQHCSQPATLTTHIHNHNCGRISDRHLRTRTRTKTPVLLYSVLHPTPVCVCVCVCMYVCVSPS